MVSLGQLLCLGFSEAVGRPVTFLKIKGYNLWPLIRDSAWGTGGCLGTTVLSQVP